jgi:hypothetical protein
VSLDDAFGDGKSETGALTPSPGGLPKSVKDTGQVLGRDARSRICNREDDLVTPRRRASRDPTASLREFDGVANEVLEHLKEPIPIPPDLGNNRVHFDSKLERSRRCERSQQIHCLVNQPTCRQSRSLDGQLSCLQDRDIQEILNQAVHARGCAVDNPHGFQRSSFGLRAPTRDCRRLQQDRGQRIPQVMGDDAEYLIAEVGGVDRSAIETRILDRLGRSLR